MATINVRRLDDDAVRDLKRRAARNNRSLEGEVRQILEEVVKVTRKADEDMAANRAAFQITAAEFRRELAGRRHTPAELLIRDDRDFGH